MPKMQELEMRIKGLEKYKKILKALNEKDLAEKKAKKEKEQNKKEEIK